MESVRLEDVAHINPRCPRDLDETQAVSFLAMASVSEEGQVLDEETRTLADTKKGYTYFERGDVLLAKITPCFENGKAAYLGKLKHQIGFGSTEFHVIRPIDDKLDPKYLFYLVWNDQFRFYGQKSMTGAAGQKRVSADFLKSFEIPLPPLPEQRRIAAILDKADAIRRKRQQAIRLTEEFLRSVFLDMFGDPVTNPKGWEVVPLGEITCIDAPMVDPREEQYQDLLHIGPDRIEKATGRLFPAKTAKEDVLISGKFLFDERHVLYSKIRPLLRKVALPGFSGLCSADVYPVRPNDEYMTKEFLWYVLLSDAFLNYTQTLSSRANIPKINRKEFFAYPCYLPPLTLQNEFSARLHSTGRIFNKLVLSQENSGNLFDSLVQRVFHGEL